MDNWTSVKHFDKFAFDIGRGLSIYIAYTKGDGVKGCEITYASVLFIEKRGEGD